MTSAQQIVSTIFQITINPDPNFSVGPKVGERPGHRALQPIVLVSCLNEKTIWSSLCPFLGSTASLPGIHLGCHLGPDIHIIPRLVLGFGSKSPFRGYC